jgi:hypothetical protein
MKKIEIKRRKRVIPALTGNQHYHDPSYENTASGSEQTPPQNAHTTLPHHNRHLPDPSRLQAPPPVDFTTYQNAARNISTVNEQPGNGINQRKRSHSGSDDVPHSNGRSRPEPAVSGAGSEPGPMSVDSVIDPSLGREGEDDKQRSKARLRLERERLREQLLAVEEELARSEDGQ